MTEQRITKRRKRRARQEAQRGEKKVRTKGRGNVEGTVANNRDNRVRTLVT